MHITKEENYGADAETIASFRSREYGMQDHTQC